MMRSHHLVLFTVLLLVLTGCGSRSPNANPTANEFIIEHVDVEKATDVQTLVTNSELVIVGRPVGQVREVSRGSAGADFYQDVRVDMVLKGDLGGKTVRVVRYGLSTDASTGGVRVIGADDVQGRLKAGRLIVFLQPSAEQGVYQVVGHSSGEMILDAAGRVVSADPQVSGFTGLDIEGVLGKIREVSAGD